MILSLATKIFSMIAPFLQLEDRRSIEIYDDNFTIKENWKKYNVHFNEIISISSIKIDMVTYDEIFLIIETSHKDEIYIGELYNGFEQFQLEIVSRYNLNPEWREEAEKSNCGDKISLWISM